jgi:hypothetical protein
MLNLNLNLSLNLNWDIKKSLFSLLSSLLLISCAENIDLYAPEKDIWVVYGVLDPNLKQQDIRVGLAFQVQSNAFEFAENHDPAVKGLQVWLEGEGKRWEAVQVDSIRKDTDSGNFGPYTTVYRLQTEGDHALKPGVRYTLFVASGPEEAAIITATSRIPPAPRLLFPRVLGSLSDRCLMSVPFEDSLNVVFRKKENLNEPGEAFRFQVGVKLSYEKNGQSQTWQFGPSRLFAQNQGCGNAGDAVLCYYYPPGTVMRSMEMVFGDTSAQYSLDQQTDCGLLIDLDRYLEVQVTAVDSALGQYMVVNDPTTINFNTYRREYSNLQTESESEAGAVGVFGAVNYHRVPIKLTPCGMYRIGFNPFAGPDVCD